VFKGLLRYCKAFRIVNVTNVPLTCGHDYNTLT